MEEAIYPASISYLGSRFVQCPAIEGPIVQLGRYS